MHGIERFSKERLPQAMDSETEWRRRIADVVLVSAAIAESADLIFEAIAARGLEDDENAELIDLARSMRRQALDLSQSAPVISISELRRKVSALDATCNGCHGKYRQEPLLPHP